MADLALDGSRNIRLHGEGRKDRAVPIWPATAVQLRRWLTRIDRSPDKPLFPTSSGGLPTRSAFTDRLRRAVQAAGKCLSLSRQRISPHTIRHYAGFRTIPGEVRIGWLTARQKSIPGDPLPSSARHSLGHKVLRKSSNSSSAR